MSKPSVANVLNRVLALGGIFLVLAQTIYIGTRAASNTAAPTILQVQIWVAIVLFGVLLNQVGVWGLASRVFGGRRKYLKLRAEVTLFLSKVSELNTARVQEREDDVERLVEEMQESVRRMQAVAGLEEAVEHHAEPTRSTSPSR